MDYNELEHVLDTLMLLGSKGTTGTQASFLELFDGDHEKCKELDRKIAEKMGFKSCFPVSVIQSFAIALLLLRKAVANSQTI